jgi:hypothetical protein
LVRLGRSHATYGSNDCDPERVLYLVEGTSVPQPLESVFDSFVADGRVHFTKLTRESSPDKNGECKNNEATEMILKAETVRLETGNSRTTPERTKEMTTRHRQQNRQDNGEWRIMCRLPTQCILSIRRWHPKWSQVGQSSIFERFIATFTGHF